MAEEIEIKLSLPETARRAFLRHPLLKRAERLPARRLVNVYFDTAELALHRKGIALRTRRQGRGWLQTVKLTGTAFGGLSRRPEWERPFDGRFDFAGLDDVRLRTQLERHRDQDGLEPVFETVFRRRCWRLAPERGASVLIMLDRGRIEAAGRSEIISEVEIELARGSTDALYGLARALVGDLPLRPLSLSKAERGYRLRHAVAPRPLKSGPSPLLPTHTPWEAFRSLAATCLAQFEANAQGAGEADAEFVHQMRVALRRLRSALRTFRPVLPEGFVQPPLRSLAAALGQVRDWDVLSADIVAPVRLAFPEDARLAALAAVIERKRQEARAALPPALEARALALAWLDFGAILHRPPARAASPALPDFSARRLGRLHRKALALADLAEERDPARLHALRIGVKRLRYAIEFFSPLYRARDTRRALATLTELQDTLGALNDLARAGPLLMECLDGDPALREAVALVGGWHGPRHAVLQKLTLRGMRRLRKLERFWSH